MWLLDVKLQKHKGQRKYRLKQFKISEAREDFTGSQTHKLLERCFSVALLVFRPPWHIEIHFERWERSLERKGVVGDKAGTEAKLSGTDSKRKKRAKEGKEGERGRGDRETKWKQKNTTMATAVGLSTISKCRVGPHRFLNQYLVPITNAKKEKISF